MKKWFKITNSAEAPAAEVLIYDEIGIGGVTAKSFAEELRAIPAERAISLRINSPGGSVWDAFAIYSLLRSRTDKVTAYIDGITASAATVIALAASRIVAASNAMWMIHNPSASLCSADSDDMRNAADALDKTRDQLADIYAARTGKTRAEIIAAMDATTWYTAEEAKESGFVDEISGAIEIAICARHAGFNYTKPLPPSFVVSAAAATPADVEAKLKDTQSKLEGAEAKIKTLENAMLKIRAERAIEDAATSRRIKSDAGSRKTWMNAYMRDEESTKSMLASLASMPRGEPPVIVAPVVEDQHADNSYEAYVQRLPHKRS